MRKISIAIITVLFFTLNSYAFDAEKTLSEANRCYLQNQYIRSAELYNDLTNHNYKSSDIYFNLGNAYYKLGNWSYAILNYEKALRLDPSDKDIELNLKMANLQIIDKIDPVPQIFYEKWYNAISAALNSTTWAWLSVIFFWLALLAVTGFLMLKSPKLKQINFGLGILLLIFTFITIVIAADINKQENKHDTAIIVDYSVYVKSSPEIDSKNLFILHSGSKVRIEETVDNWLKIKLLNGQDGWVENKVLRRI